MNAMFTFSSMNAVEAKTKLYDLIQSLNKGIEGYEIQLQGSKSALLINKEAFDSLLKTLESIQNSEETDHVRITRKQKKMIPQEKTAPILGEHN